MVGLIQVVDRERKSRKRRIAVPANVAHDVRTTSSKRHPLHHRALGKRRRRRLTHRQVVLHVLGQGGHTSSLEHGSDIRLNRRPSHGPGERGNVVDRCYEARRTTENPDRPDLLGLCGRSGKQQTGNSNAATQTAAKHSTTG